MQNNNKFYYTYNNTYHIIRIYVIHITIRTILCKSYTMKKDNKTINQIVICLLYLFVIYYLFLIMNLTVVCYLISLVQQ